MSGNLEIYVPLAGLVDLDAERDRLKKEIARAEQELASLQRKLDNPNFVARAPPDVVEKDKARVTELQERTVKLQDHLQRIAPEPPMSETPSPLPGSTESEAPEASESPAPESAPVPGSAQVKVATEPQAPKDEEVNLGQELKGEIEAEEAAQEPQAADPVVEEALNKLREGTKEGLSAADHHDLGVAYMSMGLVDDAMREFDRAKEGGDTREAPEGSAKPVKKAPAKKAAGKKTAAKKAAVKKAPAKKAAVKKTPAKKASAKKAAGKKSAAKKAPAKKASAKKAAGKKTAAKKAAVKKAPAKKASAKKAAGKKSAAKKAAAKKTTRGKPARKARR
uniref:histone H1-like repetitive region-containing protein n=1 Tax=Corallococcus coralloides TaxID=184914 RepID=UPI0026C6E968